MASHSTQSSNPVLREDQYLEFEEVVGVSVEHLTRFSTENFSNYVYALNYTQIAFVMLYELFRIKTFLNPYWPHLSSANLRTIRMAKAGFYFEGVGDKVRCAFCQKTKEAWKLTDIPELEHRNLRENCRFILGKPCGNITFEAHCLLRYSHLENVTMFGPHLSHLNANDLVSSYDMNSLGISTCMPVEPYYAVLSHRIQTFLAKRWPRNRFSFEELAKAGFYFTGKLDCVACYFCSATLKRWNEKDDPWERHAQINPLCPHLINNRPDIIDLILTKSNQSQPVLCMRCLTVHPADVQAASHIGLPCGHLIYCKRCTAEIFDSCDTPFYNNSISISCPISSCSKFLTDISRVYL
ncbi:IAP1 [Bugula neritina]|uniref:IAP1 n=1 Tax=Bugula neritina TaxID=10212 RepID=A0A7J7JUR8_BUGNE|nr:IAP1 [Bugula neritina]